MWNFASLEKLWTHVKSRFELKSVCKKAVTSKEREFNYEETWVVSLISTSLRVENHKSNRGSTDSSWVYNSLCEPRFNPNIIVFQNWLPVLKTYNIRNLNCNIFSIGSKLEIQPTCLIFFIIYWCFTWGKWRAEFASTTVMIKVPPVKLSNDDFWLVCHIQRIKAIVRHSKVTCCIHFISYLYYLLIVDVYACDTNLIGESSSFNIQTISTELSRLLNE